jgi:hypothetical protein
MCRIMPFRPWDSCGDHRRAPGLVGIVWGRMQAGSVIPAGRRPARRRCRMHPAILCPLKAILEGKGNGEASATADT